MVTADFPCADTCSMSHNSARPKKVKKAMGNLSRSLSGGIFILFPLLLELFGRQDYMAEKS